MLEILLYRRKISSIVTQQLGFFIWVAFLFFAPFEMVHNLWCREVYADVLTTMDEALKILLQDAQQTKEEIKVLTEEQKKIIQAKAGIEFDPEFDRQFQFFIGTTNGQTVGYAVKGTAKGKWGPIHYMVSLDPEGKIRDVIVLESKEKRGRAVTERKFLEQFVNKTINDPIKLKSDITGVAGATISSRGMSDGIRKSVYVFNELYKK